MELKLWLSFLMLCVIPDVQSVVNQWGIQVPSQIPALHGSCVVIPCTYSYPKSKSKVIVNRWRGFWKRGNTTVSTNLPTWKHAAEFKKRTRFLGNLRQSNCTMMLNSIRSTDTGPFYFRIEIPQHKRAHSFSNNTVTINVIRKPEAPTLSVTVTDKVRAFCTVFHACPYMIPSVTWNHAGLLKHQTKKLNMWKWQTQSQLTYVPKFSEFNKTLTCTVKYRSGKQAENSIIPLKCKAGQS